MFIKFKRESISDILTSISSVDCAYSVPTTAPCELVTSLNNPRSEFAKVLLFIDANPIVNAIVLFGLVVANLGLVYYISKLFITKIKLPLVYHIIVGAATLVLIVWLNVYYNTVEYVSCANYSAVDCVHSITNGRTALLCLIASATYYLLYIFIHKIVQKNVEREAIA